MGHGPAGMELAMQESCQVSWSFYARIMPLSVGNTKNVVCLIGHGPWNGIQSVTVSVTVTSTTKIYARIMPLGPGRESPHNSA